MPTNETNKTAQEQTSSNNQIAVTETEKQFIEELKATCSDSIEINKKIKEYEEERELFDTVYDYRDITPKCYKIEINLINDAVDELFGTSKKDITENKQKLIEFYNKKQTICKNAFDIYKLYDAKKINKKTFDYLHKALRIQNENIVCLLYRYKNYFKPLYAAKMMLEYGIITYKRFIYWSTVLFYCECCANDELFLCMHDWKSLNDYFIRVKKHKNDIVDLLAKYTNKPYKAIIF